MGLLEDVEVDGEKRFFKKGKSYRWVGPMKPTEWSIPPEISAIWENGKPHKCTGNTLGGTRFAGIKNYGRVPWAYGGYESNFEEVK
jgi:hypothetical protein